MEIDTTKIGKHFIISPSIQVNKLRAYDDIIVSNTSFRELFDGTETKHVDVRDMLNENVFTAEQIHAFKCDVSDYIGAKFKSVTLRHDASTGNATAGRSEVWLFVTIFDENSNIVDTFFSSNKTRQVSVSSTWLFEPFEIKNNYKIFEFRLTTEENVAQRNPGSNRNSLRSFSLKEVNNSPKLLIDNWTTIEQNGVEANYTTDFSIEIEVDRLNIKTKLENLEIDLNNHVENNDIHHNTTEINSLIQNHTWVAGCVTMCNQLNASIRSHANDKSLHLTSDDVNELINDHLSSQPHLSRTDVENIIDNSSVKSDLDSHINDESIHLNSNDVTSLINSSEIKTNFENHTNDSSIHLSQTDVENIISSEISSMDFISEDDVTSLINSSSVKSDLDSHINDSSIHLSENDVTNLISGSDLSSKISLLEDNTKNNFSILNAHLNNKTTTKYDVCYEETANHYVSITEEMIHSFATDVKQFKGNYITSVTVRKKQGDTYGDLTLASTPAWLYATCFDTNGNSIKVLFSSNSTIQSPDDTLTTWYFDDFLITSDIKTIEYSISFTNGTQEKQNKIRSASIRTNGKKLEKDGWYTIDGANNKVTFITDIIVDFVSLSKSSHEISHHSTFKENDVLDTYVANGFQLGCLHLKPGKIKKIIIPYKSSTTETSGTHYLAIQIFKHGDIDTSQQNKSKEETFYSLNSSFVPNGTNGVYSFDFDNLIIPEKFHYARFMFVSSKDVVPNGVSMENCNLMRLRPIKRDDDFTKFDIDECCVISNTGTKSNFLIACYFTYEGNIHQNKNCYSKKWRLEFKGTSNYIEEGTLDYIKTLYSDVSSSHFITMSGTKTTRNEIDLTTLEETGNQQIIILMDMNFGESVTNVYVENFIKKYTSENLPSIIPLFDL